MNNEPAELERLAGQLFHWVITPESMPEVIVSLAAWLHPPEGNGMAEACGQAEKSSPPPSYCPLSRSGYPDNAPCLRMHQGHGLPATTDNHCAVCVHLDGNRPDWCGLIDPLMHCRVLRKLTDHAASWGHTSHVAAIIVTPCARVIDCDYRGESFLKAANVLRIFGGQLCCTEVSIQPNFNSALKEAAGSGRTMNLLLQDPEHPDKRFSLTLTRMEQRPATANGNESIKARDVLCLVAPLDGRRIATARQLIDLFGLSGAEARLARALCHGDSVDKYARDHGLRLPTVRTQLSSIFNKTGTERQVMLVRLIAGIPAVRDSV